MQMADSGKKQATEYGAATSFVIFVALAILAIIAAAIGSLAPIDFIYDGI